MQIPAHTMSITGRLLQVAFLMLLHQPMALAKDTCDEAIEQFCGADSRSDRCYETLYSCGEYDRILGSFTGQLEGLSAPEQYFVGVAYLGNAERSGAISVKCSYNSYGKSALTAFLTRAQDSYHKLGDYAAAGLLRYVYHAEKVLKLANTQEGCLENGHSQASINLYARGYSERYLKSLFLEGMSSESEPQRTYRQVRDKLQGLVSSASNIETKLAMSGLEIEFARNQLVELESQITQNVGKINPGANGSRPSFDTDLLDSLNRNLDGPIARIAEKEAEFSSAFKDCSNEQGKGSCADQYAQKKILNLAQARSLMTQSTNLSQFIQNLLTSNRYHYQDFVVLKGSNDQESTLPEMARQAKAEWQSYGVTKNLCGGPKSTYWYCTQSLTEGK